MLSQRLHGVNAQHDHVHKYSKPCKQFTRRVIRHPFMGNVNCLQAVGPPYGRKLFTHGALLVDGAILIS